MSDNTQLNAATSGGDVIRTVDVSGIKHQLLGAPQVELGLESVVTLTDGSAHTIAMLGKPIPCMVWCNPTSGDSVLVEYQNSSSAPWQPWGWGTVTAYAELKLTAPVYALRATRTAGTGTTSRLGVGA